MPLRLISLMILLAGLWVSLMLAADPLPPPCLMRPDHLEMRLPNRGFTWLQGEASSGICDDVPAKKWTRARSEPVDLCVYADGPSGSGRYWNVTVGVAGRQHSRPIRGVCLMTSTVGWRTLQRYKEAPLPWLDDLDNDGKAEFIIWSSFPLREDASLAEYGLMAWVYRLTSEDSLAIDWGLSRRMAREIAQAYRSPLDSMAPYPGPLRTEAAEALERFADEQCSMLQNDAR
jgi:hypothetical protein